MSDSPLWLVSILISTFLSFFSAAFIVEIAIALIRIKKHRVRFVLRLFPIFSLPFDFFFSKLLNPLYCESCIQKLFLRFAPELKRYLAEHNIGWSSHLASQMPEQFFTAFFIVFGSFSIAIFVRKTIQMILFHRALHLLIEEGDVCIRRIENLGLAAALQKRRVKILTIDGIESPMAAYLKTILIPKNLAEELPQDEFEAIVSHELEHLHWKDPAIKLLCQIEATFFWWVPTQWWLKKVCQDQEMSADASVHRFSLDSTALASALVKIAGNHHQSNMAALCALTGGKTSSLMARLQITLDPMATTLPKNPLRRVFIGLAAGSLILVSCLM